ncbi:hypothetical protein BT96DRAFT_1007544 [Gymnopus androsaceus JB14]|uniref:Uncharacterized protein n=1 Tax=Gymnopus androsaceus JB14 TaxID=1447944 RepID=A0A6A4GH88_9AGAR|nr:hypothetical protein BT96DRAFT_1007544 [Gymnopus androsaceus JB14]
MFNGRTNTATTHSSPSHEPVPLPPPMASLRRKSDSSNLRAYRPALKAKTIRNPPPCVDSTQPRETSPKLSTSGEETAGEETHFAGSEEGNWVNGNVPSVPIPFSIPIVDDSPLMKWIDEEEENQEDLLEIEYHPTRVSNV